jgi:hypothetical protein
VSERLLQIFEASYRELRPRAPMPDLAVEFFAFVNINNTIRMRQGKLFVRLSDLLEGAPDAVLQAIAHILLAKMYRKPIERAHATRYRRHICGQDISKKAHLVRQMRGRKRIESPQGQYYNLENIFRRPEHAIFSRLAGSAADNLEPRPRQVPARSLRSCSQCHRREPRFRSPPGSSLCRGIHRLSRNAALETSSEIAWQPALRAFLGVPGGRETIPATGASESFS